MQNKQSKSITSLYHGNAAGHYKELEDLCLVELSQAGDKQALAYLIERYREFVRAKTRSYHLVGAERDDLTQEGMIGLFKAVRDYRNDRDASFKTFAEMCITRQIITAIKVANRMKHAPLNSYVSLNDPISKSDDPDRTYMELLASSSADDPAKMVIGGEEVESIRSSFLESLSEFELEVLRLYINGHSYQQIASILDRHSKSIDNALQRIKRKIEQHLMHRESLASEYDSSASRLSARVA